MNAERSHLAAVACNHCIYAIGGFGDYIESMKKFDLKESTWSFVSSMNVGRRSHAACVLRGKIYVVGGFDANNQVV